MSDQCCLTICVEADWCKARPQYAICFSDNIIDITFIFHLPDFQCETARVRLRQVTTELSWGGFSLLAWARRLFCCGTAFMMQSTKANNWLGRYHHRLLWCLTSYTNSVDIVQPYSGVQYAHGFTVKNEREYSCCKNSVPSLKVFAPQAVVSHILMPWSVSHR